MISCKRLLCRSITVISPLGYHDSASSGHSRRSSIESCPSKPRDRLSAELPRNRARGTASCDGRPTRSKQTRDNSRHSVDIARLSRQRQLQEKDSASVSCVLYKDILLLAFLRFWFWVTAWWPYCEINIGFRFHKCGMNFVGITTQTFLLRTNALLADHR